MLFAFYALVFTNAFFLGRLLKLRTFSIGLGVAHAFLCLLLSIALCRDTYCAAPLALVLLAVTSLVFGVLLFRSHPKALRPSRLGRNWHIIVLLLLHPAYLLLVQGAYLEVPSDPVTTHLHRIGEWLRRGYIPFGTSENSLASGTPFVGYLFTTAAVALSSLGRAATAEWVGALNVLILDIAVFSCARYFTRNVWTSLLVLGFTGLTVGTSLYSYTRYYALAPGLLCLAMVLDSVPLFYQAIRRQLALSTLLGILVVFSFVCLSSHKQEAIFLWLLFLFAAFSPSYWRARGQRLFALLAGMSGILVFVLVLSGKLHQSFATDPREFLKLGKIGPIQFVAANPFGPRIVTTWNVALGLSLCLALVSSFRFRREFSLRERYLFGLTAFLLAVPFFPPAATVLSFFFYDIVFYRLLYLPSFLICIVLAIALLRLPRAIRLVLMVGLIATTHVGQSARARHYLRPIWASAGEKEVRAIYEDLRTMSLPRDTNVYTDPITAAPLSYLSGILAGGCETSRCLPPHRWFIVQNEFIFHDLIQANRYLLHNRRNDFTRSPFPGHWDPEIRNTQRYYVADYPVWIEKAVAARQLEKVYERSGVTLYRPTGQGN